MKVQSLGRANSLEEPPRSTAYYYADLERIKRKGPITEAVHHATVPRLGDVINDGPIRGVHNDVINDGPIREVPPFRDRGDRPSPEYQTPENSRIETYSTAGTFPLPEAGPARGPPREKEPLLLELEEIGRLPLRELSHSGVRRSRSWYFCCEEREDDTRPTPWRYANLAPVTRPPPPNQSLHHLVASTSSAGAEDAHALRLERDALARALANERARAASDARAHDARLAELHGVIAELVRRRAQDKNTSAIPEEQLSDECESTTQPCEELDDDSRTEQNDTSSALSVQPTPQQPRPDDRVSTARPHSFRCTPEGSGGGSADSCERERGSADGSHVALAEPQQGWCSRRQAKMAARVKLKRTQDADATLNTIEQIRRALDDDADFDSSSVDTDDEVCARGLWWRARALRLAADRAVLSAALSAARDTAHRLSCACAVQESSSVALCCALQAADRALETYDVLLALAETQAHTNTQQREVAETVARRLLARLDAEESGTAPSIGRTLLSPGPWLQGDEANTWSSEETASCDPLASLSSQQVEQRLRTHAATLKAGTVRLRNLAAPPALFSCHDGEEGDESGAGSNMADMEVAVAMQELLIAREAEAAERVARLAGGGGGRRRDNPLPTDCTVHKSGSARRPRHWLDAQQTDL